MCNQESKNTTEHKIMLKVKLPDGETDGSDGDVVNMEYSEVWKGSSVQPRQKLAQMPLESLRSSNS